MTELMSVANATVYVLLRQMRALSAVIEISEHLYTHILLLWFEITKTVSRFPGRLSETGSRNK